MPIILPGDVQNARKRERMARRVQAPRAVRAEYERAVNEALQATRNAVQFIGSRVAAGDSQGDVAAIIDASLRESRATLDAQTRNISDQFINRLSAIQKQRVERSIARAFGVDVASIIDTPQVQEELELARIANERFITSANERYWSRTIQAVDSAFRGQTFPEGSLVNHLRAVSGISRRDAKRLARDQTAKLTTDLNRIRQEAAGINSYIWRDSRDERVVGNPGGRYPRGSNAHRDHWSRNGKEFRWDSPPPDGHPGQAIQCRCTAEPVIRLDELDAIFI